MKAWITAVVLAVCFVLLGFGIHTGALQSLDRRIGDFFFSLRSGALTPAIKAISDLGTTTGYIVIFAIVLIITLLMRRWMTALWLTVGLAAGWLFNKGLKALYHRERPQLWDSLVEPDGFSFPSGNAMVSAAFYGLIAMMLLGSRKGWVRACGVLMLAIIVLIGISRLYLGVHYASDIAGGLLAGVCIAVLCYQGWSKTTERKKRWG
ncbi:phosphatase PAP2 family protein [Fontibacillus sp. BL9]|uniref:phosphatase PAP2 family protein n=1 Tax=Fontibacillus sp. BL9 TaxID=3389971 RepID=UPI00397CD0B9